MNSVVRVTRRGIVAFVATGLMLIYLPALSAAEPDEFATWEDYQQCGRVAFFVVARIQGRDVDWKTVCDWLGPGDDGMHSFSDLENAAMRAGLSCVAVESPELNVADLAAPAIIQTSAYVGSTRPHFSVFLGSRDGRVCLLDAPHRPLRYSQEGLRRIWTGKALVFFRTAEESAAYQNFLSTTHRANATSRWIGLASCFVGIGAAVILLYRARAYGAVSAFLLRSIRFIVRKRKAIVVGCVGIGAIAAVAFWLAHSPIDTAQSGPRLDLPTYLDFGEIGSEVQTRFLTARNIGSEPLKISKIQTSCGCVAPTLPEPIAPGAEAQIPLKLTAPAGAKRVDLMFHSNDPVGPIVVRIKTLGVIRPTLCPGHLYFDAQERVPHVQAIKICYPGGQSAIAPQIASVDGPSGLAVFELVPTDAVTHSSGYSAAPYDVLGESTMKVRLLPQTAIKPGRYYYNLKLQCGQQQFAYIVPVDVSEQSRVHLSSDAVIWARSSSTESNHEPRLLDFPTSDHPIEYIVEKRPSWCDCSIVSGPSGRKSLRIALLAPPREGVLSEKIVVADKADPTNRAIISVCVVNSG